MKSRSLTSLQHPTLNKKTWKMKSVLVVMSIFKKSWSFWRHVWLASSLLKQILKNNSREVSFQSTYHLFSKSNNDSARRNWRQAWSRASTQSCVSAKALVGRLTEGELHHWCIMEPILVLQQKKHLPLFDHACKTSWSCFNLFQFLLVTWLKIPQNFPCQISLYC